MVSSTVLNHDVSFLNSVDVTLLNEAASLTNFNNRLQGIYLSGFEKVRTNFIVDTFFIKEAFKQELIFSKGATVATKDSLTVLQAPGFFIETPGSLPVMHINTNCKGAGVKSSFLNIIKNGFESTTQHVQLKDLPDTFEECNLCNFKGSVGVIAALMQDLVIFNNFLVNAPSFKEDVFNFVDTNFSQVRQFIRSTSPSCQYKSEDALKYLDKTFQELNKSFYDEVFKQVHRFHLKVSDFEKSLLNSWLDAPANVFADAVKKDSHFFVTYDETPVLASFLFERSFEPRIRVEILLPSEDMGSYATVRNLLQKVNPSKSFLTSDSLSDYYFTLNSLTSCLIKPFTVSVSEDKKEHVVLMPRFVYDYLITYFNTTRFSTSRDHVNVRSVSSVVANDMTPAMVENFVGLWDYQNDTSFMDMVEIAKTI